MLLGHTHELIGLDAAWADCQALRGRFDDAVTIAAEALARARALHADLLLAPLHRTLGFGLLASHRYDQARAVFSDGLRLRHNVDGQYEHALMMMGLAQIPPHGSDGELSLQAHRILDRLGVVALPVARLLA